MTGKEQLVKAIYEENIFTKFHYDYEVAEHLGMKKFTFYSHMRDLRNANYIYRKNKADRNVVLTSWGLQAHSYLLNTSKERERDFETEDEGNVVYQINYAQVASQIVEDIAQTKIAYKELLEEIEVLKAQNQALIIERDSLEASSRELSKKLRNLQIIIEENEDDDSDEIKLSDAAKETIVEFI